MAAEGVVRGVVCMTHRTFRNWAAVITVGVVVGIVLCLGQPLGVLASTHGHRRAPRSAPAASLPTSPQPTTESQSPPQPATIPSGDEVFTGAGDSNGWHVYVASAGNNWAWESLANILPRGDNSQQWIGQQCLTGDGTAIVAVVAPWSANNSASGLDHGAYAYAINAHTGAVTPLRSGVSLAYFNPGCGTGGDVALTTYPGSNEAKTTIEVVDAATGSARQMVAYASEVTSSVPVADGVAGVVGDQVQHWTGNGTRTTWAKTSGRIYDLTPAADGGVRFVSSSGAKATVWSARPNSTVATPLGTGPLTGVAVHLGSGGTDLIDGLTIPSSVASAQGMMTAVHQPARQPIATSLDGSRQVIPSPRSNATSAGLLFDPGSGAETVIHLPKPIAATTTAVPNVSAAGQSPSVPTTSSTPTCAVPRTDLWNQVLQPTSDQVRWAVQEASQGWLTSANVLPRIPNAQNYKLDDSTSLPSYYPSEDFPPGAIQGGPEGSVVPPQVMYGILAQESNWNQASWHALAGYGSDPLIANYYGSDNPADPSNIDYDYSDCGYGIAQITSPMTVGAPGITQAQQVAVAVDYAENIAAGTQILIQKWNELGSLGLTMNNGDPSDIENWYAAMWGYNSGVYAGSGGNGLGWRNNPANPIYPANRTEFLFQTYTDAQHPQDWPYQEKVMGWINTPQFDPNTQGTRYPALPGTVNVPGYSSTTGDPDGAFGTFCSLLINNCDPTNIGTSDPCPAEDSSCWWDSPVTWVDCSTSCSQGQWEWTSPQPEPAPPATNGYCSAFPNGTSEPSGSVLVDDTDVISQNPNGYDPNVIGCPTYPANWASAGSLTIDNGAGQELGPSDVASIDLHQIGAGFGGHSWFTHTTSDDAFYMNAIWSPNISKFGSYDVKVFVPTPGATTAAASYRLYTVPGSLPEVADMNQGTYSNQWVDLGDFLMGPGGTLQLSNLQTNPDGGDIAFGAALFTPVSFTNTINVNEQNAGGAADPYSFEGWGTSMAWWSEVVDGPTAANNGWTGSEESQVVNDLFQPATSPGQTNLGLTIARYNVGASPIGALEPNCPSLRPGAQVPSPQQSGEELNIQNDSAQYAMVQQINQAIVASGQTPHYQAFANSSPWWMNTNSCSTGDSSSTSDLMNNLQSQYEQAYANYLAGVVSQFASDGITFDTVEPFNEPDMIAWPGNSTSIQEGENFTISPNLEQTIISDLCSDSSELGSTGVAVPDENSVDGTVTDVASYSSIGSCVTQVDTHGYNDGSNPYQGISRGELSQLAGEDGLSLWMSEFTYQSSKPNALVTTSDQIAADLQYLRPRAWVYWQGLEGSDSGWGLLNDSSSFPAAGTVAPGNDFWALAQYSQFIRPGYVILNAHGSTVDDSSEHQLEHTVAAQDPSTHRLIVVSTNDSSSPRTVEFDYGSLGAGTATSAEAYQSLQNSAMAPTNAPTLSGSSFAAQEPADSVTTYVLDGLTSSVAAPLSPAARPRSGGGVPAKPVPPPDASSWRAQAEAVRIPDGPSGRVFQVCVRSLSASCVDPAGGFKPASITCTSVPGEHEIWVTLSSTDSYEIDAGGVTWSGGFERQVSAAGGVSGFSSAGGATINWSAGGHSIVGTVRC